MHQLCQIPFRISRGNVGFLLRCCSGKGPHLAMTGDPCCFSRVGAVFSSYDGELREPLMLPQGSPISIRVARGSRGLLSSYCRANRRHLGLCPGNSLFFSSGHRDLWIAFKFMRGVRPRLLEAKNSALLSSCDGYLLEPIEWPTGSQASCGALREESGLLSRP